MLHRSLVGRYERRFIICMIFHSQKRPNRFANSSLWGCCGMEMAKSLTTADLLTLDASRIRTRFEDGSLSALDLISHCLQQIHNHDQRGSKLRAIDCVGPHKSLLQQAQQLDDERASGHVRSPLHGIPILIKVSLY